ncbi:MAG TPA: hypothetical protein VEL70_09140 [Candidatus Acidoferrum sp.]|nr:hypothetical protein [Candidatus Acidoferrum sp.]
MIYDSYVWKKDLKKELNNFRKLVANMDLSGEPGIPDTINLKVEKFFFVSAFIIRKLKEATKLSDELNEMKVSVVQFERINKDRRLHFMNNHDLEKFYNLENGSGSSLGLAVLCNILIHSFVFRVAVSSPDETDEKETVSGIFVNSDYSKDKALYYVELDDFLKIVEETISDYVISSSYNIESGKIMNSRKSSHDNLHQIVEQFLG